MLWVQQVIIGQSANESDNNQTLLQHILYVGSLIWDGLIGDVLIHTLLHTTDLLFV